MIRRLVPALAAATLAASAAGDTIVLRSTARLEELPVRLADVAALTGPAATALADIPIAAESVGADAWTLIDAGAVRRALESLPAGRVDWIRLTIHGSGTHVRLFMPTAPAVSAAVPAAAPTAPALRPGTVRALVAPRLASVLGVDEGDLRLEFDARDDALLESSADGRTVEIRPTAMSDRMPVAITVYERDRVVASGLARVGVVVRREVAVASHELRRGEVLTSGTYAVELRWISPSVRPAEAASLDGTIVRTRLRAGQMVTRADVEAPLAIKRGDVVLVHAVSGSMAIKRLSRALADGRVGDVISFEPADGPPSRRGKPEREPYRARVSAPGLAVIADASEGAAP